ncbi:MAG TPA: DUF4097 family beta strand repeat-containing protein [Symbiobacteriaceae bacterium]|jgi:DUF4097 and DUF4098 domain-containing protein YvlB|nr:DUF4097 family beta strand repeat-containing protein [Symbiobacteriaceae bacterium]
MNSLKVGRVTVAVGLVAFGVGMLLDNLNLYEGAIAMMAKLWPLLLIGYGIEYMVQSIINHRSGEDRRIRWDVGGGILLIVIVLLSVGITSFRTYVLPEGGNIGLNIGPSESRAETKQVALGNAKELVADVRVGSVSLRPNVNSNEVKVEATYTINGLIVDRDAIRQMLDEMELQISEGDTIRITTDVPNRLNNVSIAYVIYAPEGLKVRAQTGTGRIDVTGYKGDLQLTSNVGRIEVNAGKGTLVASSGSGYVGVQGFEGPVEAKTNVGSVNVRDTVGTLQLESRTGSIDVHEYHGGALVAETGTGRISVDTNVILDGNVSLKTQTGSINLTIPKESSVRATVQTRTGSVTTPDFMSVSRNGTASSASGTWRDGQFTVTLEASTGGVHFATK